MKKIIGILWVVFFIGIFKINVFCEDNYSFTLISNSSIAFKWNTDIKDVSSFKITRKIDDGTVETIKDNLNITSISYVDSYKISPFHKYSYSLYKLNKDKTINPVFENIDVYTGKIQYPEEFTITNQIETGNILKWKYSNGGEYRTVIERRIQNESSTSENTVWEVINECEEGENEYNDSEIEIGKIYYYRIKSVYSENVYSKINPENATGLGISAKLDTPQNLVISDFSLLKIQLNWDDIENEKMYIIERKINNGKFEILDNDIQESVDEWNDTDIKNGAYYTYRVKAKNGYSLSEYSNEVSVLCSKIESPSDLEVISSTKEGIKIQWVDNSDNETGFEVWRKKASEENYIRIAKLKRNEKYFLDKRVIPNITYNYKVRGYVLYNNMLSEYSDEIDAEYTLNEQNNNSNDNNNEDNVNNGNTENSSDNENIDVSAVLPPTDINYQILSENSIMINWKDNSKNETGFEVFMKSGSDDYVDVYDCGQDEIQAEIFDIDTSIRNYIKVKSINYESEKYSFSEEIEIKFTKPSSPNNLICIENGNKINIKWKDNSLNESEFVIEKSSSGTDFDEISKVERNKTSYIDENVKIGETYFYRVKSSNLIGDSSYTESFKITKNDVISFDDIREDYWAYEAIKNITSKMIMNGYPNGEFLPENNITRAEFICMMVNLLKINDQAIGSFNDVKAGMWYYNYVLKAKRAGLISGDEYGNFNPNSSITREDIAVIVKRGLAILDKRFKVNSKDVLGKYEDMKNISPYAVTSVNIMIAEGLMLGKSEKRFEPRDLATRGEVAALVNNIFKKGIIQ